MSVNKCKRVFVASGCVSYSKSCIKQDLSGEFNWQLIWRSLEIFLMDGLVLQRITACRKLKVWRWKFHLIKPWATILILGLTTILQINFAGFVPPRLFIRIDSPWLGAAGWTRFERWAMHRRLTAGGRRRNAMLGHVCGRVVEVLGFFSCRSGLSARRPAPRRKGIAMHWGPDCGWLRRLRSAWLTARLVPRPAWSAGWQHRVSVWPRNRRCSIGVYIQTSPLIPFGAVRVTSRRWLDCLLWRASLNINSPGHRPPCLTHSQEWREYWPEDRIRRSVLLSCHCSLL